MRNFKCIVAISVFVFVAGFMPAQNSPKADEIIKQSNEKFKSLKDLTANFIYILSNPNLETPVIKKGEIIISGNQYHITFPAEEMICNEKYVWIVLTEEEEITKTDFDEEDISLLGIFRMNEKDNKTRYDGNEGGLEKVTLFANSSDSDIWKTELWLREDYIVAKAKMYARNASQFEYQFDAVQINTGVNEAVFNLDETATKYQDFIFNDLTEE
jgi:outer membrane lipoprotein-sorting protein